VENSEKRALLGVSAVGINKELKKIQRNKATKNSTLNRCVASYKSEKFEFEPLQKSQVIGKNWKKGLIKF
jgi:hypothetical protein